MRRGRRSGLYTMVAVHSTARGPSLGGCRMWSYEDSRAAVVDALRLSRAMTSKSAVAGLPLGGGKGVIMLPAGTPALDPATRRDALLDFGETVAQFDGRYVTAEDVGTSDADMTVIAEQTEHVAGLALERGGSGDPSPWTALGVETAIRVTCERVWGTADLAGRSIAVIGLGHVGGTLARGLAAAGASLVLADVALGKRALAEELGAAGRSPAKRCAPRSISLRRARWAACSTTPRCRCCAAARWPARRTTSWHRTRSRRPCTSAGSSGRRTSSRTRAASSTSPSSSSRRATRPTAPAPACSRSATRSEPCSTWPRAPTRRRSRRRRSSRGGGWRRPGRRLRAGPEPGGVRVDVRPPSARIDAP